MQPIGGGRTKGYKMVGYTLTNIEGVELRVLRNALRHEWDNLQGMKTAEGVRVANCKPEARPEYEAKWNRYDHQQKAVEHLIECLGESV